MRGVVQLLAGHGRGYVVAAVHETQILSALADGKDIPLGRVSDGAGAFLDIHGLRDDFQRFRIDRGQYLAFRRTVDNIKQVARGVIRHVVAVEHIYRFAALDQIPFFQVVFCDDRFAVGGGLQNEVNVFAV